ncbi:hypothetical protein ACOT81_32610 [Streptomyces sp. WI04-05B]|uniref:hypothetical protein n=1 Tax=Streptomyces TaxID=1883 RepID=UPI0029BD2E42|nr:MULTISPECIES: hypothetical protein [unclassified Streptomyces]MDX2547319.1 hypothetical protein [Streptomyces sp. WI04-05B]MDX2589807.1 hypothetical protein [Streptomyces sp. WI04-05A]MDX3753456.1 hypothetical protein [Streptomyces sp. AK08-02]
MHLIHVQLSTARSLGVPEGLAEWFLAASEPADGLEHVSVHSVAGGVLTLGLFLATRRLRDAESSAFRLASQAVERGPLDGRRLVSCGGVLVPQYYDGLLDGTGRGRFRPGANPSDGPGDKQE